MQLASCHCSQLSIVLCVAACIMAEGFVLVQGCVPLDRDFSGLLEALARCIRCSLGGLYVRTLSGLQSGRYEQVQVGSFALALVSVRLLGPE